MYCSYLLHSCLPLVKFCITMNISMRTVSILFLVNLTIAAIDFSFCNGNHDVICMESEKLALSRFKQDLKDPSSRLSSWDVEDDCCKWAGVVCNNKTGHVLGLQLRNPNNSTDYDFEFHEYWYKRSALGGQLNPSLLNLKHLKYMDLSQNDFGGVPIPSFIGSLVSLQFLNLARAGFVGTIPHQLGNLSSLRFLSLEDYDYDWIDVDNLEWIHGLSHLEHLDLSGVNLGKTPNWVQVINKLPSLVELHLSACGLDHIPSRFNVNSTSLAVLDLSSNNFDSLIPRWIFSLSSLVSLDLSSSNFLGPMPEGSWNLTSLMTLNISSNHDLNSSIHNSLFSMNSLVSLDLSSSNFVGRPKGSKENGFEGPLPLVFLNMTNLEHLDLSETELEGTFPMVLLNMTNLRYLDLSSNKLEGRLPKSLGNLCNLSLIDLSYNNFSGELFRSSSECAKYALESLFLYGNKLSSFLTVLEQFKNMRDLILGGNLFSGPIPNTLGRLTSLERLVLDGNQLNGTLPQSLGHLSKLKHLDLSDNLLEGIVFEVHFTNLTNLKEFYASRNRLTLKVSPDWIPPFQLREVELASWHLGSKFPIWLQSQKNLGYLDLSYTGISDSIPIWFWNLSSSLYYLDLSHNQIYDKIPYILSPPNMGQSIYLSSNHFSGPLPRLSSDLLELDLSKNSFSGSISHFLCDHNDDQSLGYLNLQENLLSGEIPDCWMSWQSLRVIELGNNNLTGNIPSSMWLIGDLKSLHLRNNHLSGEISLPLESFTSIVVIDLSGNEFTGSIPTMMAEWFPYLLVLTLRSNKFDGVIPLELCHLTSLKVLDLAHNNLSGAIPWCINNFTTMAVKKFSSDPIRYVFPVTTDNRLHQFGEGFIDNALLVTKGSMYQYDKILPLVVSMDLSDNNISGNIPEELTSLVGLLWLNLSGNHLTGDIPKKIGTMVLLESLDLSRNQLSGEIPPSMTGLGFLSYLNLSYNNLTGKIPSSTQLQSFNASSFVGNNLCGLPLTKCSADGKTPLVWNEGENEGASSEVDWFYLFAALGFIVGFWAITAPILFIKSWRYVYFRFLDNVWTRLVLIYTKCV